MGTCKESERQRCADCRHWYRRGGNGGFCKRYPHQVLGLKVNYQPYTDADETCGEFSAAPPKEAARPLPVVEADSDKVQALIAEAQRHVKPGYTIAWEVVPEKGEK